MSKSLIDKEVVVISLIGKSQLFDGRSKAWKLNSLLGKDVFHADDSQTTNENSNINIQTYHDIKNRIIYINLNSIYDTNTTIEILNKLNNSNIDDDDLLFNKNDNFFDIWQKEKLIYMRAILLIFSVSHLIVISNPSCEFDVNLIRFLRIIDMFRNKLLPSTSDQLRLINNDKQEQIIHNDWINAGRPCSPRLLFTFENCPLEILKRKVIFN
jgi:protein SMG8